MSKCRSCGAPVSWGRSAATGKPIPLDPLPFRLASHEALVAAGAEAAIEPHELVTGVDAGGVVRSGVRVSASSTVAAVEVRAAHFSTCPHAAGWRRA